MHAGTDGRITDPTLELLLLSLPSVNRPTTARSTQKFVVRVHVGEPDYVPYRERARPPAIEVAAALSGAAGLRRMGRLRRRTQRLACCDY